MMKQLWEEIKAAVALTAAILLMVGALYAALTFLEIRPTKQPLSQPK